MHIKREKGVALLFALGVMSLVLVTGLAFLSNALMKQKIAVNNGNSDQARLLARSVADRVLVALAAFRQAETKKGVAATGDARYVYSRLTNPTTLTGEGYKKEGQENPNNSSQTAGTNDQLCDSLNADGSVKTASSKLSYQDYRGSDSFAKWVYVHQDGQESDGNGRTDSATREEKKIIGRFAYQVLPGTKSGLSLFAMTQGAFGEASLGKVTYDASKKQRIPHFCRWGIDGDELNFTADAYNMFNSWKWTSTKKTKWGKTTYTWTLDDDKPKVGCDSLDTLHKESAFVVSSSDSEDVQNQAQLRQKWSQYWFSDGDKRISKEAYPFASKDDTDCKLEDITWLHRFNLGPLSLNTGKTTHPWYARLLGVNEDSAEFINSDKAVQRLAQDSVLYKENIISDNDLDPFGLPYLRRIGNDKGSFSSLTLLRKQIIANLNDYCDKDYVPTSDVKASEWSTSDADKMPNYTGNEKTPYINEIMFGFQLNQPTMDISTSKITLTTGLRAEIFSELISLYNIGKILNTTGKPRTLQDTHLKTKLKSLKVEFRISLNGSAKYKIPQGDNNFEEKTYYFDGGSGDHNAMLVKECTDHKEDAEGKDTFLKASIEDEGRDIDWDFSSIESTNGYWISRVNISDLFSKKSFDFLQELTAAIKDKDSTMSSISSVTVEGVKIEVMSIKFSFGGMVLNVGTLTDNDQSGSAQTQTPGNVDFVRWPTEEITLSFSSGKNIFASARSGHSTPVAPADLADRCQNQYGIFYIGGIEVKDPRQNLNANWASTGSYTSDWNFDPKFDLSDDLHDRISMNFNKYSDQSYSNLAWSSSSRITSGKVNNCSNPKSPTGIAASGSGDPVAGTDFDLESVTDPAYVATYDSYFSSSPSAISSLSTAIIRNAPMRSPWELGFIHRAMPWQTINLLGSGNCGGTANIQMKDHQPVGDDWELSGTTYQKGDAGILDEIKMTEYSKSFGKVNLFYFDSELYNFPEYKTLGSNTNPNYLNNEVVKALFYGIAVNQTGAEFLTESQQTTFNTGYYDSQKTILDPAINSSATTTLNNKIESFKNLRELSTMKFQKMRLRSQLLKCETSTEQDNITNIFYPDATNNAVQEELIGKTLNLLTAEQQSPNTFQIVIVAQTIKEVNVPDETSVVRLDSANASTTKTCKIGTFDMTPANDPENNVYFDEITGECRMLVTVEQVSYTDTSVTPNVLRNRLRIRQIEYLD